MEKPLCSFPTKKLNTEDCDVIDDDEDLQMNDCNSGIFQRKRQQYKLLATVEFKDTFEGTAVATEETKAAAKKAYELLLSYLDKEASYKAFLCECSNLAAAICCKQIVKGDGSLPILKACVNFDALQKQAGQLCLQVNRRTMQDGGMPEEDLMQLFKSLREKVIESIYRKQGFATAVCNMIKVLIVHEIKEQKDKKLRSMVKYVELPQKLKNTCALDGPNVHKKRRCNATISKRLKKYNAKKLRTDGICGKDAVNIGVDVPTKTEMRDDEESSNATTPTRSSAGGSTGGGASSSGNASAAVAFTLVVGDDDDIISESDSDDSNAGCGEAKRDCDPCFDDEMDNGCVEEGDLIRAYCIELDINGQGAGTNNQTGLETLQCSHAWMLCTDTSYLWQSVKAKYFVITRIDQKLCKCDIHVHYLRGQETFEIMLKRCKETINVRDEKDFRKVIFKNRLTMPPRLGPGSIAWDVEVNGMSLGPFGDCPYNANGDTYGTTTKNCLKDLDIKQIAQSMTCASCNADNLLTTGLDEKVKACYSGASQSRFVRYFKAILKDIKKTRCFGNCIRKRFSDVKIIPFPKQLLIEILGTVGSDLKGCDTSEKMQRFEDAMSIIYDKAFVPLMDGKITYHQLIAYMCGDASYTPPTGMFAANDVHILKEYFHFIFFTIVGTIVRMYEKEINQIQCDLEKSIKMKLKDPLYRIIAQEIQEHEPAAAYYQPLINISLLWELIRDLNRTTIGKYTGIIQSVGVSGIASVAEQLVTLQICLLHIPFSTSTAATTWFKNKNMSWEFLSRDFMGCKQLQDDFNNLEKKRTCADPGDSNKQRISYYADGLDEIDESDKALQSKIKPFEGWPGNKSGTGTGSSKKP